jgi:hypothetical protein
VTRNRLEALQWFGLFAGPIAFALEHVVGVFSVLADCNPAGRAWAVPQHPIQLGAMGVAAVVIVAAEGAAFLAYRATTDVSQEGEPPLGRIRFLSTAALIVGPIFLTLVLLSGLGAAGHPNCQQS